MSQTILNPKVASQNNSGTIQSVTITPTETIVKIFIESGLAGFTSATLMYPSGELDTSELEKYGLDYHHEVVPGVYGDLFKIIDEKRETLKKAGYLITNLGKDNLDVFYDIPEKGKVFELHFGKLPADCKSIDIREIIKSATGYEWQGISLETK